MSSTIVPVSAIATAHVVTTPSRASSAATSSGGPTVQGSNADHSAGNPSGTPIRSAPRAPTASAMTWPTSAAPHRRTVAR
ncbi:MAG: hypothetical protein ACRDOA_21770 [Streptosporangiaceae bacterium]